jgi:hypothetical protein
VLAAKNDHMMATLDENEDEENNVQRKFQSFEMIGQWIKSAPALVFAFFIGSLSDKFGRKPLMLFPLFGSVIDGVLNFINYS